MLAEDKPDTPSPKIALNASGNCEVDTPLRYSAGINASILGVRRRYGGKTALVKC